MIDNKATAELSGNGKQVICRSANGHVRWTRCVPSASDWLRLAKHPVSVDPEAGEFQYVGDENEGVIIAVFTPGRSLDFNLTYTADDGELIAIHEAR